MPGFGRNHPARSSLCRRRDGVLSDAMTGEARSASYARRAPTREVQGADLVARRIAQIGEVARAVRALSRRILTARAAVREARGVPGVGLGRALRREADGTAVAVGRRLAADRLRDREHAGRGALEATAPVVEDAGAVPQRAPAPQRRSARRRRRRRSRPSRDRTWIPTPRRQMSPIRLRAPSRPGTGRLRPVRAGSPSAPRPPRSPGGVRRNR